MGLALAAAGAAGAVTCVEVNPDSGAAYAATHAALMAQRPVRGRRRTGQMGVVWGGLLLLLLLLSGAGQQWAKRR
jgi:hypothetical protein